MPEPIACVDLGLHPGGAEHSFCDLVHHLALEHDWIVGPGVQQLVGLGGKAVHGRPWSRRASGMINLARDIRAIVPQLRRAIRPGQTIYANGLRAGYLCALAYPDAAIVYHHRDFRAPRRLLARIAESSQQWLSATDFVASAIRESLPDGPAIDVVANGFDFATIRELSGAAAPNCPREPFVVLVGDLVRWKRHDLFADGVRLAQKKRPGLQALVVGRERDAAAAARIRTALGDLPIVGSANALPYIQKAACLVSAAEAEPFGRTVIEALSLQTPVVVHQAGGPAEITTNLKGVRVFSGTAEDLADAILTQVEAPPPNNDLTQFAIQSIAQRVAGKLKQVA